MSRRVPRSWLEPADLADAKARRGTALANPLDAKAGRRIALADPLDAKAGRGIALADPLDAKARRRIALANFADERSRRGIALVASLTACLFAAACSSSPSGGGGGPDGGGSSDAAPREDARPIADAAGADAAPSGDALPSDAAPGDATAEDAGMLPTAPRPVERGGLYFGFAERFNRFYTDPTWTPARTIYVSATGTGDGSLRATPAPANNLAAFATPGTRILFLAGTYDNYCVELDDSTSGTYDAPILLEAERAGDGTRRVHLRCCGTGRQTCINLENASDVAITGFELEGGNYGVRAVGADYNASAHSRGIAVLGCDAYAQNKDPLFSGQSDWDVWENNLAHGAGAGDGHGIYLSNGSDWNIVRNNELYENSSSDFQINADPQSTCADVGIAFDDPACDAYAGTGEGGRGASDYMLVENNFFHHGNAQGANFTSVRKSVVRNNIFAVYARHGVSFWQETDNPRLGSGDNIVEHNLFVSVNGRPMLQFIVSSTRNTVANNLFAGVSIAGGNVSANPSAVWMETDATVGANRYSGNYYLSGSFGGDAPRTANASETARSDFDPAWFARFPAALDHDPADFAPTAAAPFLGFAARAAETLYDRTGAARRDPTTPGPFEAP